MDGCRFWCQVFRADLRDVPLRRHRRHLRPSQPVTQPYEYDQSDLAGTPESKAAGRSRTGFGKEARGSEEGLLCRDDLGEV